MEDDESTPRHSALESMYEEIENFWQEEDKSQLFSPSPRECGDASLSTIIAQGIRDGDIIIEKCDVLKLFDPDTVELKPKTTQSSAIIIFGNLDFTARHENLVQILSNHKIPAILKISFESNFPERDNSLAVEIQVYKNIINPILKNHYSPNTVGFFGHFQCDLLASADARKKTNPFYQNISDQIHGIYERTALVSQTPTEEDEEEGFVPDPVPVYDFEQANFLVLERVMGKTFKDWLNEASGGDDGIFCILFQILYTLMIFNSFGLRHNDLHLENILLQTENVVPGYYVYFVTDDIYFSIPVVASRGCVKIFDFDLSHVKDVVNTKLDSVGFCQGYGICNKPNTKFDTFTMISSLWTLASRKGRTWNKVVNFCEKVATVDVLKTNFGYPHRLCNLIEYKVPATRHKKASSHLGCNGDWQPPDDVVKPISEILFMGEFQKFVHRLPDFDFRHLPDQNLDDSVCAGFASTNIFMVPTVDAKKLWQKLTVERSKLNNKSWD